MKRRDCPMAMVARLRHESRLEVYVNAIRLRFVITYYLLNDFGAKDKVRDFKIILKHLSEEQQKEYKEVLDAVKNLMTQGNAIIREKFPKWWIKERRREIDRTLFCLCQNITAAASVYPVEDCEFQLRVAYIDKAIICCEVLLQEFNFIIDTIHPGIDKYAAIANEIQKEIAMLKNWKKAAKRQHGQIVIDRSVQRQIRVNDALLRQNDPEAYKKKKDAEMEKKRQKWRNKIDPFADVKPSNAPETKSDIK